MKEEMVKLFLLEEVSKYGDVMTMSSFIDCVKCGGFIDYDGYGQLVYKGQQVKNSTTRCDDDEFEICGECYSMKDIKTMFGKDMKVVWFNR